MINVRRKALLPLRLLCLAANTLGESFQCVKKCTNAGVEHDCMQSIFIKLMSRKSQLEKVLSSPASSSPSADLGSVTETLHCV